MMKIAQKQPEVVRASESMAAMHEWQGSKAVGDGSVNRRWLWLVDAESVAGCPDRRRRWNRSHGNDARMDASNTHF